jgi:hypothetical protein
LKDIRSKLSLWHSKHLAGAPVMANIISAKALARDMAIAALWCWYRTSFNRANALIPREQVRDKL